MTSTPKAPHTPGPLTISLSERVAGWYRIQDEHGNEVADVICEGWRARQLAAAPELYEALRNVLPLAESFLRGAPSHPDNAALDEARAALAKVSAK